MRACRSGCPPRGAGCRRRHDPPRSGCGPHFAGCCSRPRRAPAGAVGTVITAGVTQAQPDPVKVAAAWAWLPARRAVAHQDRDGVGEVASPGDRARPSRAGEERGTRCSPQLSSALRARPRHRTPPTRPKPVRPRPVRPRPVRPRPVRRTLARPTPTRPMPAQARLSRPTPTRPTPTRPTPTLPTPTRLMLAPSAPARRTLARLTPAPLPSARHTPTRRTSGRPTVIGLVPVRVPVIGRGVSARVASIRRVPERWPARTGCSPAIGPSSQNADRAVPSGSPRRHRRRCSRSPSPWRSSTGRVVTSGSPGTPS